MMESNVYHQKNSKRCISKECIAKISPTKQSFSGNFSHNHRVFGVNELHNRNMKGDEMLVTKDVPNYNMDQGFFREQPVYEDPRDVIGEKPKKAPRKRLFDSPISPRSSNKDGKILLKDQKRKLTRKYEKLISNLMERCEENLALLSEKENQIIKLKDKLKSVLEYNKLFAEENDNLRAQNSTLLAYFDECKLKVHELETRNEQLELKSKDLEEKVKQCELPDRDYPDPTRTVPLVEVCMSCSSRQILLTQLKEHNSTLHADMHALKDLLYRLTTQLSKYQERLRSASQNLLADGKGDRLTHKLNNDFESLIATSLICNKQDEGLNTEKSSGRQSPKLVDTVGLLSAQALVPLFDAYQENINEKEKLIHDYEKQFENINTKSKTLLQENKTLQEQLNNSEEQLLKQNKVYRKICMENETVVLEKKTLLDRVETAESKLKEVYELYEDKMAAMMRDYETLHREYFCSKTSLSQCENKLATLEVSVRDRTVPVHLHERRVDHCKRLLDELKHQYTLESERKTEQIAKLQEQKSHIEEKYNAAIKELEPCKEELKTAIRNVKLYKKAATLFRARAKSSNASMNSLRRYRRRRKAIEPTTTTTTTGATAAEIAHLQRIRDEIRQVKTRAFTSLQELERRIRMQEREAARAQRDYQREMERAQLLLEHKENIIRNLIDKVADVEEIRLSQTNTHRLQGIASSSSSSSLQEVDVKREQNTDGKRSKLVPGNGGYFQHR